MTIGQMKNAVVQQWKRMPGWWLASAAALGVVAALAPHQTGVLVYKLALVTMAVLLTYWADRTLFLNAFPITPQTVDEYPEILMAARLICRALVALAIILGLTSGI